MDREAMLVSVLTPIEGADQAIIDAAFLDRFVVEPTWPGECQVRGRLLNIEQKFGLGPTDLDEVWSMVGLVRGLPQPPVYG